MREVRGTMLERPLLIAWATSFGNLEVERLAILDHMHELLVGGLW